MQNATGLLHDALIDFFENKDIESVLSVFSDDIHCYGFADDSVVRGIGQLRELLDRTSMENITSYRLTFYEIEELSNTARESLGVLVFSLSSNNMSVKYRVSATAQSISGTARLTMLHFSVVNPFHKAGMFADAVQDRIGKELLETATAGGMMGGYMEEGFPFYFINQKMLDYLGYENEAMFVEDNQGLVSNCMHPEDRVRVKQQTYRQIEETGEYQVEYRMRKRNGSYIWVHDIGRALTLENGRKVILSVCYDITSDKEHSRLIENLVDTMNGGIVLYKVDSDWKLSPIYISAGVGGITNRSNNEYTELCEEDVLDSVYQEDRKLVRQAYRDAVLNDKITSLTYRVPDKNGGYLWLNGMFSLFGEQGGFPVLRAVFTPATIQYDLQLQALSQSATGIVVLDADTSEVYYANETSFLLHSTERQDYIGKKCHEVFDKKGRRCTHCWRENITQEQESIDCTMVDHGKIFSVHAERRNWNGRRVFIEYLQDVTQQRQLQEKIQASNGELEAILQNVDCGFCVCRIGEEDHTIDVRYLSDSYCRLFEGSEEELRTAYAHDPRYGAHPNDLPKVRKFMQRIFSTYQPGEITCRCRTAKGNWKWVTLKFTFVQEPHLGLLVYITCIDVSEQMRIQEQLRLDEEMNEAACHFAGLWTWSYNIDTGDAYLSKKMQKDFGMPARLQHYPESFLDYLLVFPEYESLYLEKIAQIREGAKEVAMAVQARFPDGPAHWIRIKINVLASSETDPAIRIAIGSALSIDQEKSLESRIKLEHQKTAAYDPALLRYTVTNITSDLVVEHKILQGGTSNKKEIRTLEQAVGDMEKTIRKDCLWKEYRDIHTREKLISLYANGTTTMQLEARSMLQDGDVRWIKNILNLHCDPSTNDLYLYEYTYDINQQKTLEEILYAAIHYDYERFGRVSLNTGRLFRVFNRKERTDALLQADDYTEASTEYGRQVVLPEDREMFLHKISLEEIRRQLQQQDVYEFTHRTVEGGDIRYKRTRFALYDTENQLVLMTRSDITELVQEDEKKYQELQAALGKVQASNTEKIKLLGERQQLYAALFNIIPLVISVNLTRNCYKIMNYDSFFSKQAETEGLFDDLISTGATTVPEEDRQRFADTFSRENLLKAYGRGEKTVVLEHRQNGDDGSLHWAQTMVIFVKGELDEDLYEITLAQDITARKQQEQNLHKALETAEAANRAKSEFLSRMSHEIRTPMNAIMGMISIAKENDSDYVQVSECLEKIDQASHYLLTLINDILEMSRIESGRIEVRHAEFDFSCLIESVRTIVESLAINSEIRLEFINRVQGDGRYSGDMTRIQQILVNLLSNAIKFTKAGGRVRFTAEAKTQSDALTVFRFTVADTGIGMSEAFMSNMFKPFTQEDGKNTSKYSGSGLGLAIAKNLVEAMHGTIHAESFIGVGSTFTVEIPLGRPQSATRTIEEPVGGGERDDMLLKGAHVLVAEDHPLNVMVATRILQRKGVVVTVAENGQLAVDRFSESPLGTFDAILMDIRMPVMDGLDATRHIRNLSRTDAKSVPIIAMTANALNEDRQKTKEAGMNEHLSKPFDPAQLYRVLAEQIEKVRK